MFSKEKLIEIINSMPEEKFCDMESLFEEIILFDKIENSLQAAERGETHTEKEMNAIISKW
jgi:predicted transcriptional regulator